MTVDSACDKPVEFLRSVIQSASLSLSVHVQQSDEGCRVNLEGPDADLLISQGGEALEALQHLVNQAFAHDLTKEQRIICDAQGFRATRDCLPALAGIASALCQRLPGNGSTSRQGSIDRSGCIPRVDFVLLLRPRLD